ncbi:MAG: flagellar basal body rod protein FlgB [Actinobacteria bacterium]|nr:flagellar basal body rod protein FlgB [Actinomycetota bacterium]MCL6094608.1 flagellar basal body rod protein FlgB [Actinomycetota bacterium]
MQDATIRVLTFAVDSLSLRQQVIADNIANNQTPGYTAEQVSFEKSLEQAISSPGTSSAHASVSYSTLAPGTDGNNVSLSQQMVDAEKTSLGYQTMISLLTSKFNQIRDASQAG